MSVLGRREAATAADSGQSQAAPATDEEKAWIDRVGPLEDDDLAPDREPDDSRRADHGVDAVQRQSPATRRRSALTRPRLSAAVRMSERLLSSIGTPSR